PQTHQREWHPMRGQRQRQAGTGPSRCPAAPTPATNGNASCPGCECERQSYQHAESPPAVGLSPPSRRLTAPQGSLPMQKVHLLVAVVALVASPTLLLAADGPLPSPGEVKTLTVHPAKVGLVGSEAHDQVVLSALIID